MSIFRSISKLIQTTADTATNTIGSLNEGVDTLNHTITEHSKKSRKTTTTACQAAVARFNEDLRKELDADADLLASYEKVVAEW